MNTAVKSAFTPMPSTLAFGPPADVSMGWDGTVWALDTSGAPHRYDPLGNSWAPQGQGVDAAALVGDRMYHFRGSRYVTVGFPGNQTQAAPQEISNTWPDLPCSFTQGLDGAAGVNGELYLFRGGWYLPAGTPTSAAKLTDLTGWPLTPDWIDGVIDAVSSDGTTVVQLFRGAEYIQVDLSTREVLPGGPAPIAGFGRWQGHLPPEWATGGIDAAFSYNDGFNYTIYRGSALVTFAVTDRGEAAAAYIPTMYGNWPAVWNPVLAHAPAGRAGNLYAATSGGGVLCHDGAGWNAVAPLPGGGQAKSVSVGRDGAVYAATAGTLHQLTGGAWSPGVTPGFGLGEVAVGDATRVWVLDTGNNVHNLDPDTGSFTLNTLTGQAIDMAANADGTLWHCSSDNNAYRFISEGTQAPEAIALPPEVAASQGSVQQGSVQKVASTGFGNAYCLVQPGDGSGSQLYTYTSDYLFKTSASYNTPTSGTIARGLGMLFVADVQAGDTQVTSTIVALDPHTGRQRWCSAPSTNTRYTNPVFDPVNELLYVGVSQGTNDTGFAACLVAIDANTGALRWTYDTPGNAAIDAAPALSGTSLCFGDRNGAIYAFNTVTAATGSSPVPTWREVGPLGTSATRVGTPLILDGQVYAVSSLYNDPSRSAPGEIAVTRWRIASGETDATPMATFNLAPNADFIPRPPVAGTTTGLDGNDTPALFINASDRIVALYWTPFSRVAWKEYPLGILSGVPSRAMSELTYDGARVWFGSEGRLFALDGRTLRPPTGLPPVQMPFPWSIETTPVVYTDTANDTYVLFGAYGNEEYHLWIFDPTRPAGAANPVSIETGQTAIAQLSALVTNGVIYAAGRSDWSPTGSYNPAEGQVFAINVDRATQALRAFIIESQLMQDFDEPPPGQSTPPSFARYQTHLSVVDDHKAPRPSEPVKIWADQPMIVSLNGAAPVPVGPGDDDFAAALTGADGTMTITSGHLSSGGDKPDMYATPLRVWAGFMDQYERVVIYPDREFHNRIATTAAVTDQTNPNYDNPDVVNLHTAQNYAGTPLFTSKDQQQNQPQQIAAAIQHMTTALHIGRTSSNASGGWVQRVSDSPEKYIAYDQLPGCGYFPANVPAGGAVTVLRPGGLSYSDNSESIATFSPLTHADATAAIDALAGIDWTQSDLASAPGMLGSWAGFWHWLTGVAAEITHVIVSVGKELYAGVRFVLNEVAYVFKHPLQAIEDAISVVGAFFKKLLKTIENVIEALSLIFHFDEILKTQQMIKSFLSDMLGSLNDDLTQGKAVVDNFFTNAEETISSLFDELRTKLGSQPESAQSLGGAAGVASRPISGLNGMGATPTTAFTVGPQDHSAPPSSHSVRCTWAMHKVHQNYGKASSPATPAAGSDPISDFIAAFLDSLQTNATLQAVFAQTKADLSKTFAAGSVTEFLEMAVVDLLDLVEDLVIGALAVVQAMIDGLLALSGSIVDFFQEVAELEIPVLSALWKLLTGKTLTVIDLIAFVVAIPATLLYKIVDGHWPSESLQSDGASNPALRRVAGIATGVLYIFAGWVTGALDAFFINAKESAPILLKIVGVFLLLLMAAGSAYAVVKNPSTGDVLVLIVGVISIIFTTWGGAASRDGVWPGVASFLNAFIAGGWGMFANYLAHQESHSSDLLLISKEVAGIPAVVNPLKLLPADTIVPFIVPIADLACRAASGALIIADTINTWNHSPAEVTPA